MDVSYLSRGRQVRIRAVGRRVAIGAAPPLLPSDKHDAHSLFTLSFLVKLEGHYRVTHQVVPNLLLTSKQKFHFGLARPGQARPKWNICFEVNGRFCTS